jgi:hypothetical protein
LPAPCSIRDFLPVSAISCAAKSCSRRASNRMHALAN